MPTPVTTLPRPALDAFLARQFGPAKGAFLAQHGDWWHRGPANRFVIQDETTSEIASYFATTPTHVNVAGQTRHTLWWIDLVVDPAHRRRGLQRLMDDAVRLRPGLKLGFPNAPHAKILARHGWRIRHFPNLLLPLRPTAVRAVQRATGQRGLALKTAAALTTPLAALWRRRLLTPDAGDGRLVTAHPHASPTTVGATSAAETVSADTLAAIYTRHPPGNLATTVRDAAHLQWRYLDAPYRDRLRFFLAGPPHAPTHYAISRHVTFDGRPATRLLDLYGDFADQAGLITLLRAVIDDAIDHQSAQITATAGFPQLQRTLLSLGFFMRIPIYFCYNEAAHAGPHPLDAAPLHWTLGDSDNDLPY